MNVTLLGIPSLSLTPISRSLGWVLLLWSGLKSPVAAQQSGDFSYSSNGSVITITGYTGPGGAVSLPPQIAGLPVRTLGANAFASKSTLTSMVIPDTVTAIQAYAFSRCTGLASVTLPGSLTTIGLAAFADCTALTSATIPDGVTSISSVFSRCTRLASVTLPDSVTSFSYAFEGCTGLTSIVIPARATSVSGSAFTGCTALTSVTIPSGVLSIGDNAFFRCRSLTSVTIPGTVRMIGYSAFDSCSSLTSITIPSSVTFIRNFAFYDCAGLTNATFDGDVPAFGTNVFINTAPGFTVYYYKGSAGFTSPVWQGYPSVELPVPTPEPGIETISFSRGATSFTWVISGKTGWKYQLQRNQNLSSTVWVTVVASGILPDDQPLELTDPEASTERGFYRVVRQLP